MVKTPEEIKKWMECCSITPPKCNECPANIEIGGKALMEGVVGRPKVEMQDRCGKRLIVKIKACDFVEE